MEDGLLNTVYITSTGWHLPGPAVANDQVETVLGAVNGQPSGLRGQIQKANGIQTRHYGIDANQRTTVSNTEMAVMAGQECMDRAFRPIHQVG
ncbi:MAG: 3-oxoacyl-ACP synthase, partial [Candidatus Poseidoniaceae archaeon]